MVTNIFRINKGRESEFTSKMESCRLYHGHQSDIQHLCRELLIRSKSQVLFCDSGEALSTRRQESGGHLRVCLPPSTLWPLLFMSLSYAKHIQPLPGFPRFLSLIASTQSPKSPHLNQVKGQRSLLGIIFKFNFCPSMDL